MTGQARRSLDHTLADEAGTSALLLIAVSAAIGYVGMLGAARISRLLEAIADGEFFHDLTMID